MRFSQIALGAAMLFSAATAYPQGEKGLSAPQKSTFGNTLQSKGEKTQRPETEQVSFDQVKALEETVQSLELRINELEAKVDALSPAKPEESTPSEPAPQEQPQEMPQEQPKDNQ